MHRVLVLTWLVLACATAAHAQTAGDRLTPTQIAARARGSVVLLRTSSGLGSGFVIDKSGRIATNLHVLAGGGALTVVDSEGHETSDVEVLAVDQRFLDRVQRRYPRIASKVFLNLTRLLSNMLERTTQQVVAARA